MVSPIKKRFREEKAVRLVRLVRLLALYPKLMMDENFCRAKDVAAGNSGVAVTAAEGGLLPTTLVPSTVQA